MSLKDYEDQEKIRLAEGKKSRDHYKSVNLPGDRVKTENDIVAARKRLATMAKEREKPNHE